MFLPSFLAPMVILPPFFLTLHFYPHFFNMKGESTPCLLSKPNGVNFYAKGQVYLSCFPLSTFTNMWAYGVSAAQAGSRQAGALTQDEDAPTARSRTRDAAATARRIAAQPGEVGAGREARARRVPGRGKAHHGGERRGTATDDARGDSRREGLAGAPAQQGRRPVKGRNRPR